MFKTIGVLFALLLFSILSCSSQNLRDTFKSIEHDLDSILKSTSLKSISVAISKKGKSKSFHMGKLIDGSIPNDSSLYEIASLTKTFTGLLLAKAIQDEKVKLDDDIRIYLKGKYSNLEYDGQPIRLRHLVTHTSGLPHMLPDIKGLFENADWDKLPFKINTLQKGYTKFQFLKDLKEVSLDTLPGYNFSYSNAGANLVGLILENIYDRPYEELLKKFVFEPLNMNQTQVGVTNTIKSRLLLGTNNNGNTMPFRANKELNAEGGIISTTDDMI